MNESVFFQDLAVVMSVAGLAAVAFSRFGWPKVFGYLLVGILMNEHTWGGSFLADVQSVRTISQLGVVFLMLTMGLELSTSDMKKIKRVTVPTAILDTVVMVWLGCMVGTRLLGWGLVPSLFLGTAICDSATTLLAKMIGELGWSRRPFVKYTLGTSVCEDMVCVGLIALVTGFAGGSGMSLGAVGMSMGGLLLFFLGTLVFGLILIPRLLTSVAKRKDDESLVLALLGICFFVSYVAYRLDYSLALGAFLVGILGASSEVKNRLLLLVAPLRSMFSAMFFVSIGLLVDPAACWANVGTILLLSAVVVFGKGLNCFVGGILTGQTVKESVQMGMSLAQIGEFAFMVAILFIGRYPGGDTSIFVVTIGVSLLTTLLNPFLIRWSDPAGTWAERRCPKRIARWLETYRAFLRKYQEASGVSAPRRKVRRLLAELCVIAALELVVAAVLAFVVRADLSRFSPWLERYDTHISLLLLNLFLFAMAAPLLMISARLSEALNEILVGPGDARWQHPVRNFVRLFVYIAVFGGFETLSIMINAVVVPDRLFLKWCVLAVVLVVGVLGWRFIKRACLRARMRFEEALEVDERLANLGEMMTIQVPRNAIEGVTLAAGSPAVGETVVSLNVRSRTGASIVSVERAGVVTRNIGPEWTFRAGDTLHAIGNADQIAALKALLTERTDL